jgi:hypothetical protein
MGVPPRLQALGELETARSRGRRVSLQRQSEVTPRRSKWAPSWRIWTRYLMRTRGVTTVSLWPLWTTVATRRRHHTAILKGCPCHCRTVWHTAQVARLCLSCLGTKCASGGVGAVQRLRRAHGHLHPPAVGRRTTRQRFEGSPLQSWMYIVQLLPCHHHQFGPVVRLGAA